MRTSGAPGKCVGRDAANPLAADLDHVLAHTGALWEELRGQRLFITGGTGFIGCWLLESLLWANDKLGLDVKATVLTRDPEAFQKKAPHLANHPNVVLHMGDVKSFAFPEGAFPYIIHAATESSTIRQDSMPLQMVATIVDGTRRVLDFAARHGTRKLLFLSSGAVYGPFPPGMERVSEDYAGAPDPTLPVSAYGEAKRLGELLCVASGEQNGFEAKIARCFAFVGPYLPLDGHFAVGNFLREAMARNTIEVLGDGAASRSYLYAADMTIWLWAILFKGPSRRPFNVGSEEAISIRDLADVVAHLDGVPLPVWVVSTAPKETDRPTYIPNARRAVHELGLSQRVSLLDALKRTLTWWNITSFKTQARSH